MRVLMTTDAVGGVWQYSLSLARGLVENHRCKVALVCLGEPRQEDLDDIMGGSDIELVPLRLRLEWMPDSEADVRKGLEEVERLVARWQPDLIHSSQFCFGTLESQLPKLLVAHSDVLSWRACRQQQIGEFVSDESGERLALYRQMVTLGLQSASAVVCPSHFAARSVERTYGCSPTVIYNGLWPDLYPSLPKTEVALVVGRLWDEAKNVALAVRACVGLPLELCLVGSTVGPTGESTRLPEVANARYLGARGWQETRALVAQSTFYLATSWYEPFGLAPLEAALCGCVLLANDIPAYRELWGPTALFYRRNDARDLRRLLTALLEEPEMVRQLGEAARQRAQERFTADRMAAEYYRLYCSLCDDPRPDR